MHALIFLALLGLGAVCASLFLSLCRMRLLSIYYSFYKKITKIQTVLKKKENLGFQVLIESWDQKKIEFFFFFFFDELKFRGRLTTFTISIRADPQPRAGRNYTWYPTASCRQCEFMQEITCHALTRADGNKTQTLIGLHSARNLTN